MFNRLFVLLLVLAVWMCQPVLAAEQNKTAWYSLPNGMKVCIVSMPGYHQTVMDTWFTVGSRDETSEVNGISHFLEHVMFKSRENEASFDTQVEAKGGMTNAATSKDFTHYYYVVPAEQESDMLKLHLNMLFKPAFPAAEVKREQGVVQEEIYRAINAPFRILFDAIYAELYSTSPHIAQTVLGPPTQIETYDSPVVKQYYAAHYQPSKAYVLIATPSSDTTPILKAVEAVTGQPLTPVAPPTSQQKTALSPKPKMATPRARIDWAQKAALNWNISIAPSVPMPTVLWVFPEPEANATLRQQIAHQIYLHLLAEGQDSQLNQAVVEQATDPAYSVGASWIRHAFEGFSFLYVMNDEASMPIAIQRLRLALQDEGWFTPQRFERAKKEIQLALATQKTLPSSYISNLGESVIKGQLDEFNQQDAILQALTLEDVLAAREQALRQMRRSTIPFVLLTRELEHKAQGLTKQWAGYRSLLTKSDVGVATATLQPSKRLPSNGVVPEAVQYPSVVRKYLPGSQLVDVAWHVPVSHFSLKDHAALQLLGDLWLVKPQRSVQVAPSEYLKDLGVRVDYSYDADVVMIRSETTTTNALALVQAQHMMLERGQALMYDVQAFEVARTNAIKSIRMLETNPQGLMQAHAERMMGQQLPMGLQLDEKIAAFESLTPQDIQNIWQKLWKNTPRVLAFAGPESATRTLEQGMVLNGLIQPSTLLTPANLPKPSPPAFIAPGSKRVLKEDQATTWFMWAWALPSVNDADMPVLQLIQSYLGQGMSARLFQEVREKRSLAYEVAATLSPGKQRSTLNWYAGVKPENVVKAREVFRELLVELTEAPLMETQLNAVKEKRIGRFEMSLNTPAEWATLQGRVLAQGLPSDYLANYAQRLNAVTPAQLQRVARQYLGSQPDLELILGNPSKETAKPVATTPATQNEAINPDKGAAPNPVQPSPLVKQEVKD
jgi:zinc protease